MKLNHGKNSVYYNETISYNYEIKLSIYHIFMKELIVLLKNEILPNIVLSDFFKFFPLDCELRKCEGWQYVKGWLRLSGPISTSQHLSADPGFPGTQGG